MSSTDYRLTSNVSREKSFNSVRIGDHYRAVAQKHGDLVVWFWIGTHEDYNNLIRNIR